MTNQDNRSENNHGCFAGIGDLVELLNPMGNRVGIFGLVYAIETSDRIGPRRYLRIQGQEGRTRDALVRIISRA
mgnify:CR=1 FL=1